MLKDKDKAVWEKFALLERKLDSVQVELNDLKKTEPELLREAKSDSIKTSRFKNRAQESMEKAQESADSTVDLFQQISSQYPPLKSFLIQKATGLE